MAAVLSRTRVGLKDVSTTATVPDNPKARLMYYLDCICTVLDLSNEPGLRRLIDYKNYRQLTSDETDALLALCSLFRPDVLLNKCIFHSEEMCGDSSNKFFELTEARQTLAVTERIVIGNQVLKVVRILVFKMEWLQRNYFLPLASFRDSNSAAGTDRCCTLSCCLLGVLSGLACILCSVFLPVGVCFWPKVRD